MRASVAITLLSATILAGSAPAFAQTTNGSGAAEAAAPGEIIVTAQRRSESIQRVPVSVTALSADQITSQNLNDLTQIARAAPSLQVGTDNSFAVRGIGTLAFAGTIDSSVAIAIDEVNLGRPLLNSPLLNDLERVEVLNGPQGLLFGKNASAGLLNIVTARPKLGVYASSTNIELDSRETPGASGSAKGVIARETLNIPVTANSALRLSGLYSYQEPATTYVGKPNAGTRHDLNARSYSLKGKYLADLGALNLYVIADYNENHGIAGIFDNTYRQVAPDSTNLAPLAADGITAGARNFEYGGDADQFRDIKTGGAQARLAYTLNSGIEISNLFAWRFYTQNQAVDGDYLSANGLNINATQARYDQYSNELRIALPAQNRLSGQVGLFYMQSSLDQHRQLGGNSYSSAANLINRFCVGPIASLPSTCTRSNVAQVGSDRDYVLDTKSYAAFGQLTYAVTDAFKLIAGGRVTHDKIDLDLYQNRLNYYQTLSGPRGHFTSSYDNTDFSWKLGAQFQATPTVMFYGFYGRGYKGPGFNDSFPTATANVVVRQETSNTAEAGVKSSLLNRHLVLNISAFHTKFNNFQVQSFDPTLATFVVQNAAQVTSKGIEANVTVLPFTGLTLSGSASLLSSKFDSFAGAQCYPTQTTMGCSATVSLFDASGLRLPVAPSFTSTVQARYEAPTRGSVTPFIEGNWYHRSSVFYAINQAPGTFVAPIDVFGANVGARVGNNLRVSLFCKNCTNEISPTAIGVDSGDANARNARGQASPKLSYTQQFGLDSVRTIGLNLRFDF
ncbi:TonB-dependent receptor [Novosphingobium pokkalii]|uniref:TonB-dependent receptor n=1 Tax=Novosphingobium pokkalii TaxID=1770194 RepID=A0ABV7V982_9SPHN|nr:TonB-dependent receptor [Novosphingobium pokkalii]GHC96682.1 TonB-dependent receptor [Novosphingobium pokkalii]